MNPTDKKYKEYKLEFHKNKITWPNNKGNYIQGDWDESLMKFQAEVNGMPMPFEIISIDLDAGDSGTVTCDFNHPMAGKALTFEIEVVDIRDADEEEIAHGHVHGDGGYQH